MLNFFLCKPFFLLAVFSAAALSCSNHHDESQDHSTSTESSIPSYEIESGDKYTIIPLKNIVKDVKVFHLPPEVAERVGGVFHFTVVDHTDLILADEISGSIIRLNAKGEILWQIVARTDDYRYFSSITECAFDHFNRHIVVYSDNNTYFYDFSGNPILVANKPEFNYHQLVFASPNDIIYSAQGFPNPHFLSESRQLIWYRDSIFKNTFLDEAPYAPKFKFVGGFPEFTRLGDYLVYHPTLHSTFYKVDLPTVKPIFKIDISEPLTLEGVMRNNHIEDKLGFLVENGLPIPWSIAANEEFVYLSYKLRDDLFFGVLDRETEKWKINHPILKYEKLVFRAPLLYDDGYFLQIMPDYRVAHYAKLANGVSPTDADWQEELNRLKEEYNDIGGKTIFLIEL